jgi:hypothetical protein
MDPTTLLPMIQALEHVPVIGAYVAPALTTSLFVMGACSLVAAHIPPPAKTRGAYFWFYRIVNWLGGNYRYARNVVDPIATQIGVKT